MKLSIITINYNDAKGLDKTIQSVGCQKNKNVQYIVIDGGSTDGSAELLETYKNFIDIGISEKDSGIYNAMNKGAKLATGEYLLFLNSGDELIDKNVIDNVLPLLKNYDMISGTTYNYSEKDAYLKIPPKKVSLFTFTGGSLPHPSSFIKRELFEKIGGYHEEYRIISDWCFFVEALIEHNCSYTTIPNIITKFNRYGISSTSGHTEENRKQIFLKEKFGRIIDDYLPTSDEALSNVMYWISEKKNISGKIYRFPIRVVNRIHKLRNRLDRRIKALKQ